MPRVPEEGEQADGRVPQQGWKTGTWGEQAGGPSPAEEAYWQELETPRLGRIRIPRAGQFGLRLALLGQQLKSEAERVGLTSLDVPGAVTFCV